MRVTTAMGEFQVKITKVRREENVISLVGEAQALWAPLPIMGTWEMKMNSTLGEIVRLGGLMIPTLLRSILSRKKAETKEGPEA